MLLAETLGDSLPSFIINKFIYTFVKMAVSYMLLYVNVLFLFNAPYKNIDTLLVQQFSNSASMHLSHNLVSWL